MAGSAGKRSRRCAAGGVAAPAPAIPGLIYFLGPTGGFLAGFVLLALIVGYAADRG